MSISTPRRVLTVAVIAAATAVAVYVLGDPHHFFDLKIYWQALRWWTDGHPLYDYAQPDRVQGTLYFTYPPLAAVLLWPLAQLPLPVATALISAATLVALGATVWWLVRPLARRQGWPAWYALGLLGTPMLLLEPVRETFWFGQVSVLLAALIVGDLLLLVTRDSRWAGVGIGLATALKLYPGIFVVHLLVTRRWRAAATAAGTAAGATLLVAAFTPTASWTFWTYALWSTDRVGRLDYTGNQSLRGAMSRLTAPEGSSGILWLILVLAIVGFGLWRVARLSRDGSEISALTVTGMIAALVSPITWPHHVFWFIPAVIVLVGAGLERDRRWWLFAALVYAVGAFGVVTQIDWGAHVRVDDPFGVQLLRSLYLPAMLALVVAMPREGPVENLR